MTGTQRTLLTIGLSAGALLIAECLALVNREEGDTISARGAEAIRQYPVVAGVGTAVIVHMATPTRLQGEPMPWWRGPSMAIAGGIALGLAWCRYDRSRPMRSK